MANKVISSSDLIAKFQYALDEHWGYIMGTAGEAWTAKKQQNKVNYMVLNYGEDWKKNADAKKNKYYTAAMYGAKWEGHTVADCSGMFSWAFSQLGGYMYHGSNTMFLKYTTASGSLKSGKRTDGKELKPGTAVFVWSDSSKTYSHVGLYIGNGYVIEAASTQSGVIKTKVSEKKWTYWGELKGVEYVEQKPEPIPEGYAEVTGKRVALRTAPTTQANIIMRIDTGKRVKLETEPPSKWDYVSYNGKTGYMMKEFLKE